MTESIVPLNYLSTSGWLWPSVRITTRGVLEGKASADVERFTPNQYSEISLSAEQGFKETEGESVGASRKPAATKR